MGSHQERSITIHKELRHRRRPDLHPLRTSEQEFELGWYSIMQTSKKLQETSEASLGVSSPNRSRRECSSGREPHRCVAYCSEEMDAGIPGCPSTYSAHVHHGILSDMLFRCIQYTTRRGMSISAENWVFSFPMKAIPSDFETPKRAALAIHFFVVRLPRGVLYFLMAVYSKFKQLLYLNQRCVTRHILVLPASWTFTQIIRSANVLQWNRWTNQKLRKKQEGTRVEARACLLDLALHKPVDCSSVQKETIA